MAGVRKKRSWIVRGQRKRMNFRDRQNTSLNRRTEKKMYGQFLGEMPETVDKDKP